MSKFCSNCGKELEDNALFCDSCGTKVQEVTSSTSNPPENFNSNSTASAPNVNGTSKLNELSKKRIKIGNTQIPILPVIIAAALILVFIIVKCGFGGSAYETPFNNFEMAINNSDSSALQNVFLPSISSSYQFDQVSDSDLKSEFENDSIKIAITDKKHITGDDILDVVSDLDSIDEILATDCYIVDLKITLDKDGDIKTSTLKDVVVLKVNGKWYLATDALLTGF